MRPLLLLTLAGCGISESASLDEFRVGTMTASASLDTGIGGFVATTLDEADDHSCPELSDDVYALFDTTPLRFEARGRFQGSKSSPATCESARAIGISSGDLPINHISLQDSSTLVEMQVAHYFAPRSLLLQSPLGPKLHPGEILELDWLGPDTDPPDQRGVSATFNGLHDVPAEWTGNRARIRVPIPMLDETYGKPMSLVIRANAGARVIACDVERCTANIDFTAVTATFTLDRPD